MGLSQSAGIAAPLADKIRFFRLLLYIAMVPSLFTMVEGYLPILLRNQGLNNAQVGSLGSIGNMAGIPAMLLLGWLLDRYQRYRLPLILSLLGTSLLLYLLSLGSIFMLSSIIMVFFGIFYQVFYSTFEASIVYQCSGDAKRYGIARSFSSIGYAAFAALLGLSGILREPTNERIMLLFAIICTMTLLAGFFLLSSRPLNPVNPVNSADSAKLLRTEPCRDLGQQDRGTLPRPMLILLLSIGVVWGLIVGSRNIFFPIYIREVVGSSNIGLLLAVATASEIPVLLFSGRIFQQRSLGLMFLFGFGMAVLRLLLEALLPYYSVVLAIQLLHAFAFALFFVSAIAIINRYFGTKKAQATTVLISLRPLTIALFGSVSGWLADYSGYSALFLLYCAAASLLIVPIYRMRWQLLRL